MQVLDIFTATINIPSTNSWNKELQQDKTLKEWDWSLYINNVKRFQLDYFGRRYQIEKYFPLNTLENGDIGRMYK